jgi:hypothetical protein
VSLKGVHYIKLVLLYRCLLCRILQNTFIALLLYSCCMIQVLIADELREIEKFYASDEYESFYAMASDGLGGYVIVGGRDRNEGTNGASDGWILHVNRDGHELLNLRVLPNSSFSGTLYDIVRLPDGDFIAAGWSTAKENNENDDGWILRFNVSGRIIWNRRITSEGHERFYFAKLLAQDRILTGGRIQKHRGSDARIEGLAVIVDARDGSFSADQIRRYGLAERSKGAFLSAEQMDDGDIAFGGWSTDPRNGMDDVWILRTKSSGEILWTETYGANGTDMVRSVVSLADGGLLAIGRSTGVGQNTTGGFVMRLNSIGKRLWHRRIDVSKNGNDALYAGGISSKGGFYAVGTAYHTGRNSNTGWLLYLNSDGQTISEEFFGTGKASRFYDAAEDLNGTIALAGFAIQNNTSGADGWFISRQTSLCAAEDTKTKDTTIAEESNPGFLKRIISRFTNYNIGNNKPSSISDDSDLSSYQSRELLFLFASKDDVCAMVAPSVSSDLFHLTLLEPFVYRKSTERGYLKVSPIFITESESDKGHTSGYVHVSNILQWNTRSAAHYFPLSLEMSQDSLVAWESKQTIVDSILTGDIERFPPRFKALKIKAGYEQTLRPLPILSSEYLPSVNGRKVLIAEVLLPVFTKYVPQKYSAKNYSRAQAIQTGLYGRPGTVSEDQRLQILTFSPSTHSWPEKPEASFGIEKAWIKINEDWVDIRRLTTRREVESILSFLERLLEKPLSNVSLKLSMAQAAKNFLVPAEKANTPKAILEAGLGTQLSSNMLEFTPQDIDNMPIRNRMILQARISEAKRTLENAYKEELEKLPNNDFIWLPTRTLP